MLYGVLGADPGVGTYLAAMSLSQTAGEAAGWSWTGEHFAFRACRCVVSYSSEIPAFVEDSRGVLGAYGSLTGEGTFCSERSALGEETLASIAGTPAAILSSRETPGTSQLLRQLDGLFVFVLWDKKERRLHLARSRIGGPPLYYSWVNGVFIFSTRLDVFRKAPGFSPRISRDALALLLRYSCIPSPHTIYHEVYKLAPGTLLTVNVAGDEVKAHLTTYWTMREVIASRPAQTSDLNMDSVVRHTEELILKSIRRRRPRGQVGVFLSGGIDSAVVAALTQSVSTQPIRSFTVGVSHETLNEAAYAKQIAAHLGTEHTEVYLTARDAMSVIPRLPDVYDEPFADPSQIPTLLLCELTGKSVKVVLSGDGGDEVFCGYNRYVWGQRVWSVLERVPLNVRRAVARGILSWPTSRWDKLLRPVSQLLPSRYRVRDAGAQMHRLATILDVASPEEMYVRLASQWREPTSIVVGAVEPQTIQGDVGACSSPDDFVNRMMYLDLISYLPDDVLVKVLKAAAVSGIDVRPPLLDMDLIQYAWSLPLCMHLHEGEGKRVLKEVLYRHIPRSLTDRPKAGFGIPLAEWLRGPLRDWAESLLDEHRLRHQGFLRPEPIRRCWEEHLSGKREWHYHLWAVLMFQAWLDMHHC